MSGDRVQANQNLLTFAPDSGREIRVQVPASIGLILSDALSTETPVTASADRSVPLQLDRVSGAVRDNTGSIDAFFVSNAQLPPTGSILAFRSNWLLSHLSLFYQLMPFMAVILYTVSLQITP